jgi:hypothetical protein
VVPPVYFTEADGQALEACPTGAPWLFVTDRLRQPADGAKGPRITIFRKIARSAGSFDPTVEEVAIRLRIALRLYFSSKGEFCVRLGTGVVPYFNDLLAGDERRVCGELLEGATCGAYGERKRWKPGSAAMRLHEAMVRWVKSEAARRGRWRAKNVKSPTMWRYYAELRDIADRGESDRADRIVEAMRALLQPEATSGGRTPPRSSS